MTDGIVCVNIRSHIHQIIYVIYILDIAINVINKFFGVKFTIPNNSQFWTKMQNSDLKKKIPQSV